MSSSWTNLSTHCCQCILLILLCHMHIYMVPEKRPNMSSQHITHNSSTQRASLVAPSLTLCRCPPLLGLSVNKADGFQCSSCLKHAAISSRKPFLGTVEKDPMPARDSRSPSSKPYFMVNTTVLITLYEYIVGVQCLRMTRVRFLLSRAW